MKLQAIKTRVYNLTGFHSSKQVKIAYGHIGDLRKKATWATILDLLLQEMVERPEYTQPEPSTTDTELENLKAFTDACLSRIMKLEAELEQYKSAETLDDVMDLDLDLVTNIATFEATFCTVAEDNVTECTPVEETSTLELEGTPDVTTLALPPATEEIPYTIRQLKQMAKGKVKKYGRMSKEVLYNALVAVGAL